MAKKESCPRCNSTIFATAKDGSNKHYCQAKGCGHVWIPGNEGLKRTDVALKHAKEENTKLTAEVTKLRKENSDLKERLAQYVNEKPSENEIFS